MTGYGDGRYVCQACGGEFLMNPNRLTLQEQPKAPPVAQHTPQSWPELTAGTSGRMKKAMQAVAMMPLGTADVVGPCQGHGGKGGHRSKGGKSAARQKMESWQRKTSPGRFIRSFRGR